MITFELEAEEGRPIVVVEKDSLSNAGAWARLLESLNRGVVGGSSGRLYVRADVFMAEIGVLREIRNLYDESPQLGPVLTAQLRKLVDDRLLREAVSQQHPDCEFTAQLEAELPASGFVRKLKPFQLMNLARILRLPHGADFSVPGAGKTTVALANFALNRHRKTVERMLVIGPIAAFGAWKTDAASCFQWAPEIAVHGGRHTLIPDSTEVLLTNYNRVANDYDRIRRYVADRPTMVVLDEAHRIKRGADGVHGRAVLDLAYAAHRRDVLTGTPAPQGAFDLIALVQFLYPGQESQILPPTAFREREGRDPKVLEETQRSIARYFVRTTKSKLELPPTRFELVRRPMGPIQDAIYRALIGRYRGGFSLQTDSRRQLDRIGRVVMYLLEAATNPALLAAGSADGDLADFVHPPLEIKGDEPLMDLLSAYHAHETPWKYKEALRIVAEAALAGEKVLVWSSFVRNLKALARYLGDYSPAVIHGGVPSEDAEVVGQVTRESELERFRNDPSCSVLLANPAACGEGISLHHECHHAVYLDRTFNAGQFLQSQDRIHRLGLGPDVVTRFSLLQSVGTIDDTVDERLTEKVRALAVLMNDPGLVQVSLPEVDEGVAGPPAFIDDLEAVIAHIDAHAAHAT